MTLRVHFMAPMQHSMYDFFSILKLKRLSCIWGNRAQGSENKLPRDVPPGHLAVIVGKRGKRFIIRTDYLNHPIFKELLDQAYEEYGQNKVGPLVLHCDEHVFRDIVHSFASTGKTFNQVTGKLMNTVFVGVKAVCSLCKLQEQREQLWCCRKQQESP